MRPGCVIAAEMCFMIDWMEKLNNKKRHELRTTEDMAIKAKSFPFLGKTLMDPFKADCEEAIAT